MKKIILNNHGSVFPMAMLSIFIMSMLSGVVYQMVSKDQFLIKRMMWTTQAQDLADAGLAHALGVLAANWNNKNNAANFPETALGPGTFDASITSSSGRYLVSSVGTVHGISKTVSAEVAGPSSSALDYAIAGHSVSFTLVGQSHVEVDHGSIYSDTTASLNAQAGSSQIELQSPGSVIAGGLVTTSGAGSITTGTKSSNAALATWPTPDFNYYKTIAQTNGTYVNGNAVYSSTNSIPSSAGKVLFVEGNITISRNQSTSSAIIATGSITVSGGTLSISQPSSYPALMTQNGAITFSGTGNSSPSELSASGLVYSGNNFAITGNHHHINVTARFWQKALGRPTSTALRRIISRLVTRSPMLAA